MRSLTVLTATKAEAAALINHFKLVKGEVGQNSYHNQNLRIGKQAAYQKVKQLVEGGLGVDAIVNIGIAGAKELAVGSLVWPRRVGDVIINKGLPEQQTSAMQVLSSDKPTQPTEVRIIYDMEAQGICDALTAKTSHVQVFCAKVISDNERHSHKQISAQQATDLIRRHLVEFERMFELIAHTTAETYT
jgi:hypothetical protein